MARADKAALPELPDFSLTFLHHPAAPRNIRIPQISGFSILNLGFRPRKPTPKEVKQPRPEPLPFDPAVVMEGQSMRKYLGESALVPSQVSSVFPQHSIRLRSFPPPPVDEQFERDFANMLDKRINGRSLFHGQGLLQKLDQLMDKAEEWAEVTGIPYLIERIGRDSKKMIETKLGFGSEKKRKEAERLASVNDPNRAAYWIKRHQEQSTRFLFDEKQT